MKNKNKPKSKLKTLIAPAKMLNINIIMLVLFLFSFIIYFNTLFNKYAQDDAIVITENMFTKKGFSGIPGLFSHDTFFGFFQKEGKDKLVSGGRYRPLSPASFAIEYEFFGQNPLISHLINILLYGFTILLLFKILLALLKTICDVRKSILIASAASLIFLVHPVHTEVVANIKGRDEIFSLLFSLSAILFTIKYYKNKSFNTLFYIFFLFLAALFSKENSVTILLVIPLIYYMFFRNKQGYFISSYLPYVFAFIIFMIVRTSILGFDFGSQSMELMNNPFIKLENNTWVDFAFMEKISTILFILGKYLQLLIIPYPLTNDYYPRQIPIMTFADWKVIFSLLSYIFMVFVAIFYYKKYKIVSFGIVFYLMTLSIVSNVVFPVGTNLSERFIYMPSVGFSLVIAYLLYFVNSRNKFFSYFILTLVLSSFSIITISRNRDWKDDFTLFTRDVKVSGNSAKALNAAGGSLVDAAFKEKDAQKKIKMLYQAKEYLQRALKIHPEYANALLILGNAEYLLENYDDAIKDYELLLKKNPNFEEAKKNLLIIYKQAGKYYGETKNDLNKSIIYLTKSFELDSTDYETARLAGIAFALSKNFNQALHFFKKAVALNPTNAGVIMNLGNTYYNMGDNVNGKKHHDIALKLDPNVFKNK
jgi:Flp pilus assembly protein TadD